MAERNKRVKEQAKELTPKEIRLRERQREHDRKLYLGVGGALALAAVVLVIGAIFAFLVVPNRTFASVGDDKISTQYFWKRMRLQKSNLQSQLVNLEQLEAQFGGTGYFASQISQIQTTLSNPFSLAVQTLDQLLEEKVVARYAKENNITVSDEEVADELQREVANGQGALTEAQATETAVANSTATAEAAATATANAAATTAPALATGITDTVTLTSTGDLTGTSALTAAAAISAVAPLTTVSDITVTTGVTTPVAISATAPVSAEVAGDVAVAPVVTANVEITNAEAVSLAEVISDAVVEASAALSPTATAEPIPTRAVITETGFTDGMTQLETNLDDIAGLTVTDYRAIIRSRLLRTKVQEALSKDVATTEEQVKARHILIREIQPTATPVITDTTLITPTPLPTEVPAGAPTPTPTQGPRTITEAMTIAMDLANQLKSGTDFATLAQQKSEDYGSGAQGGDLGWFAKGAMVPEFEKVAFALQPGQVSDPFTTTFGVHILKLDEKDTQRPLEDSTLEQNRAKAYDDWLQAQLAGEDIQRPDDLTTNLPSDLR